MSKAEWFEMTEEEWLDEADDQDEKRFYLLESLGLLTDRKVRLFGCACVREVWDDLPEEELRQAVWVCERFADGQSTATELREASRVAGNLYQGIGDIVADHTPQIVRDLCHPTPSFAMAEGSSAGMSAVVAEVRADKHTPWHVARKRAKQVQCHFLRDIFGNPFRTTEFDPVWRSEAAVALAESIYADRAFDRMTILADALEEGRCDDSDVLNHCRTDGPHVRGCWVVDAVLGKD